MYNSLMLAPLSFLRVGLRPGNSELSSFHFFLLSLEFQRRGSGGSEKILLNKMSYSTHHLHPAREVGKANIIENGIVASAVFFF